MSKKSDKFVELTGSALAFKKPGEFTLDFSGNEISIARAGVIFSDAKFAGITSFDFGRLSTLNLTGIAFVEAGDAANSRFEPDADVNRLINDLLTRYGVEGALGMLTVNGGKADAFKLLWDFLDDPYVAGGDYYNTALNASFVRLGIEYAEYLDAGGAPLTGVVAKYAADNGDVDIIPQRYQSMHDNLLGNIATVSIEARNLPDALEAQLIGLVPAGYGARPVYSGDQGQVGGANHDGVRSFDYDRGWAREDYLERDYNAVVHASASRDTNPADGVDEQMFYGNGNPIDDWNIVRHEGAEVELALKVKHRGGDEYAEDGVAGADGITHYTVVTGGSPTNANRAEWNFDFSATDYSPDAKFAFTLELDVDPSTGEDWRVVYSSAAPLDSAIGDGSLLQNSFNVAFVDVDPGTPGTQHYGFGEAEFGVRLTAREVGDTNGNGISGEVILVNEIRVHVEAPVAAFAMEEPAAPFASQAPFVDMIF